MWNHAPAMWVETRLRNMPRPAMDEQQAADLFAFFYSLRFFEEPGDAARGKRSFYRAALRHLPRHHDGETAWREAAQRVDRGGRPA